MVNDLRVVGPVVAIILAFACGHDVGALDAGVPDAASPDASGPDASPEDAGEVDDALLYAQLSCRRLAECAPTAFQMIVGGDIDACVARQVETMRPAFDLPGAHLQIAGSCSERLESESCGEVIRLARAQAAPPSECYLPGTLPDGEPCTYPLQCQSSVCLRSPGTSCGECVPQLELGDDCAGLANLIGSPCGFGRACADGVCVPFGDSGEECDPATAPCYADLGCIEGVCSPLLHEGDTCNELLGECDMWSEALVCKPSTSTCVAGTFAQVGEQCGIVGNVPTACAASDCFPDPLDGTCTARAADGETCDDEVGPGCVQPHAQCVDGVCEQYFTPVCD